MVQVTMISPMLRQSIVFMGHPMVLGIIHLIIWDFIMIPGIHRIITDLHFTLDLAGDGAATVMVILTIHIIIILIIVIGMVTTRVTGMVIMLVAVITTMGIILITGQGHLAEDLTHPQALWE